MVEAAGQRRFRFSIRALMIAIALCALFLVPLIWMYRHLELQVTRERMVAEYARAQAAMAIDQARSAQVALNPAKLGTANQPRAGNLWAALSVNHAVFKAGQTKNLRIEFSVVNDGDKAIDPKIAESRIVINGNEFTEPGSVFGKDAPFKALSPGESLRFDWLLGDYLKEPGLYRVCWKGVGFQSSEIVLRILPDKPR
jgi:hypothetical protein